MAIRQLSDAPKENSQPCRLGLAARIRRRLGWYVFRFKMDNPIIGWLIGVTGNRVQLNGITVKVDNPLIQTRHKSTIFFGLYELPERRFVEKYVNSNTTIVELGGSIGVVACIANKRLCHPDRHIVVEANPTLIPTLESNREINQCGFLIKHAAVAYGTGEVCFSSDGHFLMGHLAHTNESDLSRVQACTLSELVLELEGSAENSELLLLCDIEGAEIDLIRHDLPCIASRFRTIIMETHPGLVGTETTAAALLSLEKAGFEMVERDSEVVVMVKK